jgi:iron complex transport system ATP-binding protein
MTAAIRIENLTIARGQKILCRDLNFTIAAGDFLGILGPNGSGKTTLLQTLCGELAPRAGNIFLNNTPLTALSAKEIARAIGMLFQDSSHAFPQTVYDYCLAARYPHHHFFASPSSKDNAEIVSHALQLFELNALAGKNIQQLSGGEKRRVELAALFVQAPLFYLLDEPANHLDLPHQLRAMHYLKELADTNHAVVTTLHDVNLAARYCSKILMINGDGRAAIGTRQEMLTTELLSDLYQHPVTAIHSHDQTYWMPQDFNTKISDNMKNQRRTYENQGTR